MSAGIGGHQSARMKNDEWLTPPYLTEALGPFDLDPCSPVNRPWPTATSHFTKEDDGLSKPWVGFVWCNPPYGAHTGTWLRKLHAHGNGIALIFARTETADFVSEVWTKADAVMFLHGRLYFHYVDGRRAAANSGGPSALIAYGGEAVRRLERSGLIGTIVRDWRGDVAQKGIFG